MRSRKLTKQQQKMWRVLQFLIRLFVLTLPLTLVPMFSVDLAPIREQTALQTANFLGSMGVDVQRDRDFLSVQWPDGHAFEFYISDDCSGWKSIVLVIALVLAVPGIAWSRRLWGMLIGVPVAWLANMLRIISVVLAEKSFGVETALIVHDWLWALGTTLIVLAFWAAWINYPRIKQFLWKLFSPGKRK